MNFASMNCKYLVLIILEDWPLIRNFHSLASDNFILFSDGHYFNQDGQCIACERFLEYRRRSKRIAKKRK